MRWTGKAIFSRGALRPVDQLPLHEQQVVELTVDTAESSKKTDGHSEPWMDPIERAKALEELRRSPGYAIGGKYPARDELHER